MKKILQSKFSSIFAFLATTVLVATCVFAIGLYISSPHNTNNKNILQKSSASWVHIVGSGTTTMTGEMLTTGGITADVSGTCFHADEVTIQIYMYHYFRPTSRDPVGSITQGNSITPETLHQHMEKLQSKIDSKQAVSSSLENLAIYQQKNCFPTPLVVILTADDGRWDNRNSLLPEIKTHPQIVWTLGIISNTVSTGFATRKDPFMTQREIQELLDTKQVTLASHSYSHEDLTTLSGEALVQQLCQSKKDLENRFHTSINTIIYPGGKNTVDTRTQAHHCHYTRGLTTTHANESVEHIQATPYQLNRLRISKETTIEEIFEKEYGEKKVVIPEKNRESSNQKLHHS